MLIQGRSISSIDVPLPREGRLLVPLAHVVTRGDRAEALVIKDGGDDPDVTHRARIRAIVHRVITAGQTRVVIRGGSGVGRVTKPGLPVPVGEAAINPAPRRQIEAAILEALEETGEHGEIVVTIEVDDGESIALKTLNPRLGILGGISILGTRGTVKPFSNKAYKDTITMSLDVARAQGLSRVALATGGKSERLLRDLRPELPDPSWIQVGDFFAFSLREASKRGFASILYACFFGKLIKMAQGHHYTHARKSRIDFEVLSSWCASTGLGREVVQAVSTANTSREALEYIRREKAAARLLQYALAQALDSARRVVGSGTELGFYLFDFDDSLLATRSEGDTPDERKGQ